MNNNLTIIPEQIKQMYQSPDFKEHDLPCAIAMLPTMIFSEYTSIRSSLKQRKIKTIREALVHAINIAGIIYNLCMLFHFTKHRESINLFFLITAVFNITIHRYSQKLQIHKNEEPINQTTFEEKNIQTNNDESQQNKTKELDETIKSLKDTLEKKKEEKRELKKKHEIEITEKIKELKDELETQKQKFKEQNEHYMALLEQQQTWIDQNETFEKLKTEHKDMTEKLSKINEETHRKIQNKIEKIEENHEKELREKTIEIYEVQTKNKRNQTIIKKTQQQIEQIKTINEKLKLKIEKLKFSLKQKEKRILSQNITIRKLLGNTKKLTEKLTEKEEEKNNQSIAEYIRKINLIQEKNKILEQKRKTQEQEIRQLQINNGIQQKKINKQGEKIQDLNVLVGKLKIKTQKKNDLTTSTHEEITRLNVKEESEDEKSEYELLTQSCNRYPINLNSIFVVNEQSNTPFVQRRRTKRSTSAPSSPNFNKTTNDL